MKKNNRYQNQTWFIKILRWIRWKPLYSLKAIWCICRWTLSGTQIPDENWFQNRYDYLQHIWCCYQGLADFKMGHFYYLDEVSSDYRGPRISI